MFIVIYWLVCALVKLIKIDQVIFTYKVDNVQTN